MHNYWCNIKSYVTITSTASKQYWKHWCEYYYTKRLFMVRVLKNLFVSYCDNQMFTSYSYHNLTSLFQKWLRHYQLLAWTVHATCYQSIVGVWIRWCSHVVDTSDEWLILHASMVYCVRLKNKFQHYAHGYILSARKNTLPTKFCLCTWLHPLSQGELPRYRVYCLYMGRIRVYLWKFVYIHSTLIRKSFL